MWRHAGGIGDPEDFLEHLEGLCETGREQGEVNPICR